MLHVWRDSIWRLNILKIAMTVLQLLCGIGGVADSFLAKNKAKTMDAKLARATKWIGALFLILTMVLLILG